MQTSVELTRDPESVIQLAWMRPGDVAKGGRPRSLMSDPQQNVSRGHHAWVHGQAKMGCFGYTSKRRGVVCEGMVAIPVVTKPEPTRTLPNPVSPSFEQPRYAVPYRAP